MTELYFRQIPTFLIKGAFFKPLNKKFKLNEEAIIVPSDRFKKDDEINSLDDLLLYFKVIDYYMLAIRYIKFHIYQYIFENREQIITNAELMNYIEKYPEMLFLANVDNTHYEDSQSEYSEDDIQSENEYIDVKNIMKCIKNNYINALEILDDNCFQQWRVAKFAISDACETAAENGFFHCIKYIHSTHDDELYNLFDWGISIQFAAEYGYLNILIYAYQHGYTFNEYDCIAAANGGHLNCLAYLHNYGLPWDSINNYGRPWNSIIIEIILIRGHFDCLIFADKNGWISDIDNLKSHYLELAICGKNVECIKYLEDINLH